MKHCMHIDNAQTRSDRSLISEHCMRSGIADIRYGSLSNVPKLTIRH